MRRAALVLVVSVTAFVACLVAVVLPISPAAAATLVQVDGGIAYPGQYVVTFPGPVSPTQVQAALDPLEPTSYVFLGPGAYLVVFQDLDAASMQQRRAALSVRPGVASAEFKWFVAPGESSPFGDVQVITVTGSDDPAFWVGVAPDPGPDPGQLAETTTGQDPENPATTSPTVTPEPPGQSDADAERDNPLFIPPPPPETTPETTRAWWPWVLGGAAVALAGVGAGWRHGKYRNSQLREGSPS